MAEGDQIVLLCKRLAIALIKGDINNAITHVTDLGTLKPLLDIQPTDKKGNEAQLLFLGNCDEFGFLEAAGLKTCERAFQRYNGDFSKATTWLTMTPQERQRILAKEDENKKNEEATLKLIEDMRRQAAEEKKRDEDANLKFIAEEEQKEAKRKEINAKADEETMKFIEMMKKADPNSKVEPNLQAFACPICFGDFELGQGICLRSCFHNVCKDCVKGNVESNIANGEYPVKCPNEKCRKPMDQADVRAIAGEKLFHDLEMRMMQNMEAETKNSFHCKTADCKGWCVADGTAQTFACPICKLKNCLQCRAIHEPKFTCKQYQDEIKRKENEDKNAIETKKYIDEMIKKKEAMKCPGCQILVMKQSGCDWMQCRVCKCEICWATLGPRWGPKGQGDKTGGCGCQYPNKKCAPNCGNCH